MLCQVGPDILNPDPVAHVVHVVVELKATVATHERRITGIESWGKWLAAGVGIALLQAVLSLVIRA